MILYDVQQGAVLVDFVSPTYNSFSVFLCIMLHIELCGYSKFLSCSFCTMNVSFYVYDLYLTVC